MHSLKLLADKLVSQCFSKALNDFLLMHDVAPIQKTNRDERYAEIEGEARTAINGYFKRWIFRQFDAYVRVFSLAVVIPHEYILEYTPLNLTIMKAGHLCVSTSI